MTKDECRVGMKVYFGRSRGEKTLGEIVKMNPAKAKVKTLEHRGSGRGSAVGVEWNVPYTMMTPANGGATNVPQQAKTVAELKYSPFQPQEDIHIIQAVACVYAALSPENLMCDGEISAAAAREKQGVLNRKLQGLFTAYGRELTQVEVYLWERERRAAFDKSLADADQ